MIRRFADWLVFSVFGLTPGTPLGEALDFFVYDTLKITLLLFLISTVMGTINAYFPIERLRRYRAAGSTASSTSSPRCSVPSRRFARVRPSPCSSGS